MPDWGNIDSVRRWIEEQEKKQRSASTSAPTSDILRGAYNPPRPSPAPAPAPTSDILRGAYNPPRPQSASTSDILRERELRQQVSRLNQSISSVAGRPPSRAADDYAAQLQRLNERAQSLSSWRPSWDEYRQGERNVAETEQRRQQPQQPQRPQQPQQPQQSQQPQLFFESQQVGMLRPQMPELPQIQATQMIGGRTVTPPLQGIRSADVYSTQLNALNNRAAETIQLSLRLQQAEQEQMQAFAMGVVPRETYIEPEIQRGLNPEVALAMQGKINTAVERSIVPFQPGALTQMAKESKAPDQIQSVATQLEYMMHTSLGGVAGFMDILDSLNAAWRTAPIPGSADFYGLDKNVTVGQQIQAFGEYFATAGLDQAGALGMDVYGGIAKGELGDDILNVLESGANAETPSGRVLMALTPIWKLFQNVTTPKLDTPSYTDWATQHLNEGNEIRSAIMAANQTNPELAQRLLPGLSLLYTSGPERTERFMQSVEHQDDLVAHYMQAGQIALKNGDAGIAGMFFAAANAEKNKTAADYYDENASIAGELAWGLTLDWMNLPIIDILKSTPEARQAASRLKEVSKISNLPEKQAAELVSQAFKVGSEEMRLISETAQATVSSAKPVAQAVTEATQAAKPVAQAAKPAQSNFVQSLAKTVSSLFDRTPETKAHWTADNAFQAFVQLMNGVTDKETARGLISWMLDAPEKLITGLTPEDLPAIKSMVSESGGKFKVSPSLFLTEEGRDAARVLAAAGDALRNMKTLEGTGEITDLRAFLGEFDNIIWGTSQKLYGLDPLPFIPNGTDSIRVARFDKKSPQRVIEYVDEAGNVIGRTEPMTPKEAQRIRSAYYETASVGSRVASAGLGLWNAQRSILADVYLHARPAHWIRNAVTAMFTLAADSNLSFEPITEVYGYLARKGGDVAQTPRVLSAVSGGERGIGEGVQGMIGQGEHWTRKFWPKYNPYASIMEKGSKIWTTATNVAGTGGRIPFGENSFYVRAFKKVMERYWQRQWPEQVQRAASVLADSGIQADFAKDIIASLTEAGLHGSKRDILDTVEKLAQSYYAPVNLADAGLHPELFAPETWRKLWNVVQDIDPVKMTRQEIEATIRGAVSSDIDNWMKIVLTAPPQPGRVTFTTADLAKDTAMMIDTLKTDAIRAGIEPNEAKRLANAAGREYTEQSRMLLGQLVDMAKVKEPTPQTTQLIGSSMMGMNKIMEQARAEVDALYSLVQSKQITWEDKFKRTQAIYARVTEQMREEIERVRALLPRAQAGETVSTVDWSGTLSKLVEYDDVAVQRMRDKGLELRSAATSPHYKAVIDAGRSYVDNSLTTLYLAAMRFPTIDSLDMIADAMRSIDSLGIQARAMQADALDKLFSNKISVDEYYALRNNIWHGLFSEQSASALAHARKILANGFHIQAPLKADEAIRAADAVLSAMPSAQEALRAADNMDEAIAIADAAAGKIQIPPGSTIPVRDRAYVRQAIKDAFGYSDEQTDAIMAVMDARASIYAKATGKEPGAWYADKIADIRKKQPGEFTQLTSERGAVTFLDDHRAVIVALEKPDISTFVHEVGHVFRRDLADIAKVDPSALEDLRRAEKALGVKNGIWTRKTDEAFAQAWEIYQASGKAPVTGLQGIFDRFKTWLNELWNTVKGRPQIKVSPELTKVFDRLLADVPQTLTPFQAGELRRLGAAIGIDTTQGDWRLINTIAKELREMGIDIQDSNWAKTLKRVDNMPFDYYEKATEGLKARAKRLGNAPTPTVAEELPIGAKGIDPNVPETKPTVVNPQPEAGPTVAQLENDKPTSTAATSPSVAGERRPSDIEQAATGGRSSQPESSGAGAGSKTATATESTTAKSAGTGTKRGASEPPVARKPAANAIPADARPVATDPGAYEDTNGVRYLSYDRLPKPAQFVTPEKLQQVLEKTGGQWTFMEHQVDNADRALTAFSKGRGFVIADATGTGKTYSGALIFDMLFDQGAKNILLVAPNDGLLKQWSDVLSPLGITMHRTKTSFVASMGDRTVTATTYAGIRNWDIPRLFSNNRWDLVAFDEAHNMKALMTAGSAQASAGVELMKYADNVLYLSATPLESVLHYGYMVDGLKVDSTFQSAMNQLGVYKRYNDRLQRSMWEGLSPQTLVKLHHRLTAEGVYIRHEMSFRAIYNKATGELKHAYSSAVRVPVSSSGAQQYRALNAALDEALRVVGAKAYKQIQAIRVNWGKALLEQDKLPVAIEIAKRKLSEGKSVAFFLFRKSAADYDALIRNTKDKALGQEMETIYRILQSYGVQLRSPVDMLLDAFPDAVKITGDEAAGSALRQANVDAFNQGKSRVAVVTMSAGGTGLSLHDKIGNFPRVQINLTSPYTAMSMEQVAGRTFRMGSQSNAEIYWMFNDLPLENTYARRVMTRMQEMGAMVRGDEALASQEDMLEFVFRDAESGAISELPNEIHATQSAVDLQNVLTPPWQRPDFIQQYAPGFGPNAKQVQASQVASEVPTPRISPEAKVSQAAPEAKVSQAALETSAPYTKPVAGTATTATSIAETPAKKSRVVGKTTQAWSDPAQKYSLQYELVELDDLNPSSLPSGAPNPNYPQELQPRDRSQIASREQINRIAQSFDPGEALADTNAIDRGTIIITNDADVVSGNGRTLAMQQLDQGQYNLYRDALIENASQFGFTPEQVKEMRRPVLVRRLGEGVDPVAFAAQANAPTTLQMNMAETARNVAQNIRESDLAYLDMGSADNLKQALSMARNQEFVQRIMGRIPVNQRAALVDANGYLSAQGVDVIRSALFAKVLGDNNTILRNYVLSPQPELANIGNGLEIAISSLANLQTNNPAMAIGDDISRAATELIQLRATGESVESRLAQISMLDPMSEEAKAILVFLDRNARSGRKIGEFFKKYAEIAINHGAPDLFGGAGASKMEILRAAMEADQSTLFQSPVDWAASLGKRMKFRMPDLTGMNGDTIDNWYDLIDWSDRVGRASGNVSAPNIGNGTAQSISDVEAAIMKLTEYLVSGRKPNRMNPQQVRAIRQMADRLMPAYDDVNTYASKVAETAANFAMLNFRDRRKIDSLMGIVFPFHFFWSRSAANWVQRMASNTRLLNSYHELNRAIEMENRQNNVPAHLRGTMPIPGTDWRITNPLQYVIPVNMYMGSDFYDPSEAQTPAEAAYLMYRKYTPAAMPGIDIVANYLLDRFSPREGKPRMGQYQVADWMPLGKIAGLSYQAATGAMPRKGFWSWDDEYSIGRIGKQIALDVINGKADKQLGLWALDNLHQYAANVGPLPEDPKTADALVQSAAQTVGANRLATAIGSYLAFPVYHLTPEERQARDMRKQRQSLAFSPDQPWGSAAAVQRFDEQTGGVLKPYSVYQQLYPSTSADENTRPGIIAAAAAKRAETQPVYAEMAAAVDAAIQANPDITPKELNEIKKPYWARIDEIKNRYPSLSGEYTPRPPYGANPQERAEWELRNLIEMTKPPGRPTPPGDDADDQTLQDYYTSLANWKAAHYKALGEAIAGQQAAWDEQGVGNQPWRSEFNIISAGDPADIVRMYDDLFFASEAEKQWADYTARYQNWNQEQWDIRRANITQVLGEDAANAVDAYLKAEKGSQERVTMMEENPAIAFGLMLAFNPAEYQVAADIFGEDQIKAYFAAKAQRPKWPGTDADNAEMQKYYAALDDFTKANPWYEEVNMYLRGRPSLDTEIPDNVHVAYYDFGKDWQKAKDLFGDDIFDLYVQANIAPNYQQWMNAHPEEAIRVRGYTEFRKAKQQVALVEETPITPSQFAQPKTTPIPASFIPGQEPVAPTTPEPTGVYRLPGTPGATGARPLPAQMQRTTPFGQTPQETEPANAFDWAMENEKFAAWEGRKVATADKFGKETRVLYEQYLMASPSEREKMRDANPILKVVGLYTYHPQEYAEATKLFGDVWAQWAAAPKYDGTQASADLRAEYWRKYPAARELHIWLYGRYKGAKDPINDETFSYDFGKDWKYAKETFGEDIWRVYINYNSKWDKATKRAYYNAHPTFSEFMKWWNQDQEQTARVGVNMWEGYPFRGGRGSYSGGGGHGGGWGGGGGGWGGGRQNSVYVRPREMDENLRVDIEPIRPWRVNWQGNPPDINLLRSPTIRQWRRSWQ